MVKRAKGPHTPNIGSHGPCLPHYGPREPSHPPLKEKKQNVPAVLLPCETLSHFRVSKLNKVCHANPITNRSPCKLGDKPRHFHHALPTSSYPKRNPCKLNVKPLTFLPTSRVLKLNLFSCKLWQVVAHSSPIPTL